MGVVNGSRPNLFYLISRLPPRIWLQGALALIAFAVLAVLGFAVIAGFVAIAVLKLPAVLLLSDKKPTAELKPPVVRLKSAF